MGGKTFAGATATGQSPPETPRMSSAEYENLERILHSRLQAIFPGQRVATLIEAPEKTSHGDIDFVVAHDGQQLDLVKVANEIGAYAVIRSNGACYLAYRRDGSRSPLPAIEFTASKTVVSIEKHLQENKVGTFAQVDVRFISAHDFDWHMFTHAYGGLLSILGHMATNAGFRIDDKGLSLRLQSFDDAKAFHSLKMPAALGYCLLSSKDPDKVMHFLGLSTDKYYAGFATWQELFTWISMCKFVSTEVISCDRPVIDKHKPEAYGRFYETWLPEFINEQKRRNSDWYKSCVVMIEIGTSARRRLWQQQALEHFDKIAEYEQRRAHLERVVEEQIIVHLLKPLVREITGLAESKQTEVLRSLRRWVSVDTDTGTPHILSRSQGDDDSQLRHLLADDKRSLSDPDGVKVWIQNNWEIVRAYERKAKQDNDHASS
jgi:hypothetical protein